MYLLKKTVKGRQYLFLMKSVCVKGTNSPKKVVVKNYGPWEKLPDDLKRRYEESKKNKALKTKRKQEENLKILNEAAAADSDAKFPEPFVRPGFTPRLLNYGHVPLKQIFDKDLKLSALIGRLQKEEGPAAPRKMQDLLFYLMADKIINPRAELKTYENKDRCFYCPWQDLSKDDFAAGLDFILKHQETLLEQSAKACIKARGRKISRIYVFCTKVFDRLRADNPFLGALLPEETAAVALDQTFLPLAFRLEIGAKEETEAIAPLLTELKDKYGTAKVYVLAEPYQITEGSEHDKLGAGLLARQDVRGQRPCDRKLMLNNAGYRNLDYTGEVLKARKGKVDLDKFCFKCIAKDSSIRAVFTRSPFKQTRDLEALSKLPDKIRQHLNEEGCLDPASLSMLELPDEDPVELEKLLILDEINAGGERLYKVSLNQQALKEREALAGYEEYLCKIPDGTKKFSGPIELISDFQEIEAIAKRFRDMAGRLPLSLRGKVRDRFIANLYICLLSMQLKQALKYRLKREGAALGDDEIAKALQDANLIPLPYSKAGLAFFDVRFSLNIYGLETAEDQKEPYDSQKVYERYMDLLEQGKADNADLILKAAGLEPLGSPRSLAMVQESLGLEDIPASDLMPKDLCEAAGLTGKAGA